MLSRWEAAPSRRKVSVARQFSPETRKWLRTRSMVSPLSKRRTTGGEVRRRLNYLVSWVPSVFVELVDRAIDWNAYGALYWLRDSKRLLDDVLRDEGLLV